MSREKKRNPAAVLSALGQAVLAFPELRVGQILTNAVQLEGIEHDVFYVEDDVLAARLLEFTRQASR